MGIRLDIGSGLGDGGSSPDEPKDCAGETQTARLAPLDLYLMLDTSGSMLEGTGQAGVTKWMAVEEAINAFILDPGAQELGVGLQYFPRFRPDVPELCTSHDECGDFGPCILSTCQNRGGDLIPCIDASDCGGDACIALGQCSVTGGLCGPAGSACDRLGLDVCLPLAYSSCENRTSCETAEYAMPAVEIGALPDNEAALLASIAAQDPSGDTPTAAALAGALEHAQAWAQTHPDRVTVAVLATDGIPTVCSPQDAAGIAALAEGGLQGDPPVPTFVIGIINDPAGEALLHDVAEAGGSQQAFLIDPMSQDLGQEFKTALEAIRGQALACEYLIPEPQGSAALDFDKVNVEYTPPDGGLQTIPFVQEEGGCMAEGGWFYDVDPAVAEPTSIRVCASTCEAFRAGGSVAIRVGCETVRPEG